MKTIRKILAAFLALTLLGVCPAVMAAEEGEEESTTVNYLSQDSTLNAGYAPAADDDGNIEKLYNMTKTTEKVFLPGGSTADSYFSADTASLTDKNIECYVQYQTSAKIPAQQYLLSVWYNTNTTGAGVVRVTYSGSGDPEKKQLGYKNFSVALPSTNGAWKQFVLVWDASADTKEGADGKTYMTNSHGVFLTGEKASAASDVETMQNKTTETLESGGVAFSGCYVYLMNPKMGTNLNLAEDSYLRFCNPVLAPMTKDATNVYTNCSPFDNSPATQVNSFNGDTYGSGAAVYNILGVRETAVTAGTEATFKFAPCTLAVAEAKAQSGRLLLAAFTGSEARQLTDISIAASTEGIGGAILTVPESFGGKTARAYFWADGGSVNPLATPVSVAVSAKASE